PQVRLVDQGGRVERLARPLVGELPRRELAELVVDERQELLGSERVAGRSGIQELGQVGHRAENTPPGTLSDTKMRPRASTRVGRRDEFAYGWERTASSDEDAVGEAATAEDGDGLRPGRLARSGEGAAGVDPHPRRAALTAAGDDVHFVVTVAVLDRDPDP